MHKIYVDVGSYNFIYQLPQILYSSLISILLNIIIRALALSESDIIDLIDIKANIKNKKKELIKFLFFKYVMFFIFTFCLLLFFWFYISCFCAVYINTQIHLITDTIVSFGLSMIYPLIIYLISGLLRMIALRDPNKKRRFFYHLWHLIQYL